MPNRSKCNSKSQLLSDQENEFLFNILGKGCFTLATCVAQLFVVQCNRRKHQWKKKCCGVVCFVKDNPKRSYFIRLYDVQSQEMLWEQEIYNKFKYNSPKAFFHTFEAHDCHVGLNFASEDEGEHFKKVIEEKLFERHKKQLEREERKIQTPATFAIEGPATDETVSDPSIEPTMNIVPSETENVAFDEPPKMRKRNKKGKQKRKLTKEDVGVPFDFRHVSHMSWGIDDGPHMERLDADMKALLEQIGIKERSKVDDATMDFIYQFVDKHGGANAVREDFAWHIPAEPSHPQGEAVGVEQHLPAAPSHPVGTEKKNAKLPATPSHPDVKRSISSRPLPPAPPINGVHLLPSSGVNVDAISTIRTSKPVTKLPHTQTGPTPPSHKPSLTARPPPPPMPPPKSMKPSLSIPHKHKISHSSPTVSGPSDVPKPPLSPKPSTSTQGNLGPALSSNIPPPPPLPNIPNIPTPRNLQTASTSANIKAGLLSLNIPAPPKSANVEATLSSSNTSAPPTPANIPTPPASENSQPPSTPENTQTTTLGPNTPTSSDLPDVLVPTSPSVPVPAENNSRTCLLNEIHTFKGTSLRHVRTNEGTSETVDGHKKPSRVERGSIAAALMSQLLKRKTTVQYSDNEYSSDEFDDDWDDN